MTSDAESNQQGSKKQPQDKAADQPGVHQSGVDQNGVDQNGVDQNGVDQSGVDQHKERVKFAEVEAGAQLGGQFKAEWAADGRSVTIKGHCPACGGLTSTKFPFGIGGSKGWRGTAKPQPAVLPSPVTIYCECGHAHEDRPPDAIDTGCGRFWAVHLTDAERWPTRP